MPTQPQPDEQHPSWCDPEHCRSHLASVDHSSRYFEIERDDEAGEITELQSHLVRSTPRNQHASVYVETYVEVFDEDALPGDGEGMLILSLRQADLLWRHLRSLVAMAPDTSETEV